MFSAFQLKCKKGTFSVGLSVRSNGRNSACTTWTIEVKLAKCTSVLFILCKLFSIAFDPFTLKTTFKACFAHSLRTQAFTTVSSFRMWREMKINVFTYCYKYNSHFFFVFQQKSIENYKCVAMNICFETEFKSFGACRLSRSHFCYRTRGKLNFWENPPIRSPHRNCIHFFFVLNSI